MKEFDANPLLRGVFWARLGIAGLLLPLGGLAERFRSTRAELEAQRKSLENLKAFKDLVFESVGTGLIAVDREKKITAFNRTAATISGVPVNRAIGRPWHVVFGDVVPLASIEEAVDVAHRMTA